MILDAGVATLYRKANSSPPGDMPTYKYKELKREYYAEKTVGMTRYWRAQQANAQIDLLIEIPRFPAYTGDVVYLKPFKMSAPCGFFEIVQAQQVEDEMMQSVTDLSLRRVDKLNYQVEGVD